jgi:alkylation response protein AidB-like acyl-CoA dehydrogenase
MAADVAWDGADPLLRARALGPLLAAAAPRIEASGALPDDVLDALHGAGLFRMLLPKRLGGLELAPAPYAAVIETVAAADASTAWCLGQASGCSFAAAYLAPDAARAVFADPRAVLAWGPGPGARAVVVPGGFRLTGEWRFASGCHHAAWLGGHAAIVAEDGTKRGERTLLFPRAAAEIVPVWQVIGLRGTGSDTFRVTDLFVPAAFGLLRDRPEERQLDAPLYRFTTNSIYGSSFAAVALGIARAMLEGLVALAAGKVPRAMARTLRDTPAVQREVGQAEARLRAARLLLHDTLEGGWREARDGGPMIPLDRRIAIRMAATHAIGEATRVVDAAYHAAGGDAVFAAGAFERRFRDIHALAQQVQARESHFEAVGRHLMGLPPDSPWL